MVGLALATHSRHGIETVLVRTVTNSAELSFEVRSMVIRFPGKPPVSLMALHLNSAIFGPLLHCSALLSLMMILMVLVAVTLFVSELADEYFEFLAAGVNGVDKLGGPLSKVAGLGLIVLLWGPG
jgi:hypothetical protein